MGNDILLRCQLGGAFHTGVEIFREEEGSGVYSIPPKSNTDHGFRLTLELGVTAVTADGLVAIIERMSKEWDSHDFHSFRHNCVDFCEVLCKELRVREVPRWVVRGHRIAALFIGSDLPDEKAPATTSEKDLMQEANELAW